MQSGFVILPSGVAEPSDAIPDDVALTPIDPRIVEACEDGIGTPAQLDRYLECRANGCSRRLAASLALKRFPAIKTDSIFNEGRVNGNQFEHCPRQGDFLRKIAEEAGVSTTGKYYCRGLAEYPGDPMAWVSDRGDVLRVARAKNLNIVDGYVTHKARDVEPMADVPIAADLVEDEVADILDANPGAKPELVRDEVYRLRTGQVDPNPLVLKE